MFYIQVQRAQDLLTAEGDLKQIINDGMAEDHDKPGPSNRRHTLFTADRQQLLDEAARQGHDVELPGQRPRWTDRNPPTHGMCIEELNYIFNYHNHKRWDVFVS